MHSVGCETATRLSRCCPPVSRRQRVKRERRATRHEGGWMVGWGGWWEKSRSASTTLLTKPIGPTRRPEVSPASPSDGLPAGDVTAPPARSGQVTAPAGPPHSTWRRTVDVTWQNIRRHRQLAYRGIDFNLCVDIPRPYRGKGCNPPPSRCFS